MVMVSRVRSTISRRQAAQLFAAGATGMVLSACTTGSRRPGDERAVTEAESSGTDVAARFAGFEVAEEPNGDLTKVVWPAWLVQFDPEVRRLYEFQITHGELMRWMPCFCGCGQSSGHRNNRDCYVQAVNADGSVVFDSMAPT
jgi:hypothetical protein